MTAPAAGHGRTTVAVGYDGSEAAQEAVRWAAEYAAAGNYRIRVVHAWVWPMFTKKLGPVRGVEGSGLRHSAEAILAEGVDAGPHGPRRRPERRPNRRTGAAAGPADSRSAPATAEPIPPSKVSWKQGSRRRCCATRPVTPASWWSAAAASAVCWGMLPDRSASPWPGPRPAR